MPRSTTSLPAMAFYSINSVLEALFGCVHRRTTFPMTPIRRVGSSPLQAGSESKTYVACLDCGKELPFDWETMRQIRSPRSSCSIGQLDIMTFR